MIKRFNVWFGGIFLTIGLVALLVSSVIYLLFSDVAGDLIWAFLGAPLGIGVAFSLLGGTFMAFGLRGARKEERLLQVGTPAEATVVSVERTGARVNRKRLWRVCYSYQDLTGVPHEGKSGFLSAEDAQSYRVGEQAFVRYDPEQPSSSIWLGRDDLPP